MDYLWASLQKEKDKLLPFFERNIRQRRLSGTIDSHDLLHHVYITMSQMDESSIRDIRNLKAYAMKVGVNYLYGCTKRTLLTVSYAGNEPAEKHLISENIDPQAEILEAASQELKKNHPLLYNLVQLFYYENYSWKEIAWQMEPEAFEKGDEEIRKTVGKYRNRGNKGVKRLRVIIDSMLKDD